MHLKKKARSLLQFVSSLIHLDNGQQKQLRAFCDYIVSEPVVTDWSIITSSCPEIAPHVAFKLLELLTSKEKLEVVKKAMGF